jgi:hypothetical protein
MLCIKISDQVFEGSAGIKSVKTKLFFSNEYYQRKRKLPDDSFAYIYIVDKKASSGANP